MTAQSVMEPNLCAKFQILTIYKHKFETKQEEEADELEICDDPREKAP